jgi:hypothetical protein
MGKIVRLTESDLTKIVKRVINENDRIVRGYQISNNKNQKLIDDGYIPYYLDLKIEGDYKIIKVKDIKGDLPRDTTFYFLTNDELFNLIRLVDNVNELTTQYKQMIDLYRKQLIGVLEQKIIK